MQIFVTVALFLLLAGILVVQAICCSRAIECLQVEIDDVADEVEDLRRETRR